MQSFRDPYSCTMISNSAKDKTQLHILSVVVLLIQHNWAPISPSIPILPSPSLSAALRNAFVSSSVRSLPSLEKPLRTYLSTTQAKRECVGESLFRVEQVCLHGSHLSSSSSIKPLPSTSRTLKTSLTLSGDMALRPTSSKNFFGSKVSSKKKKHRKKVQSQLSSSCYL